MGNLFLFYCFRSDRMMWTAETKYIQKKLDKEEPNRARISLFASITKVQYVQQKMFILLSYEFIFSESKQ